MAYRFPLAQIRTVGDSAAFLKNTVQGDKLLFKGSHNCNSWVKSEPQRQK